VVAELEGLEGDSPVSAVVDEVVVEVDAALDAPPPHAVRAAVATATKAIALVNTPS